MSGRRDEVDKQNLYASAREALINQGVAIDRTRKSVIDGIIAVMGGAGMGELEILKMYINSVADKTAKPERLVSARPLKFDMAMRMAAARAMAHPTLISPNSHIRYVNHVGSKNE
jgi:hypothetical protein